MPEPIALYATYQLRAQLNYIEPPIWRSLLVPSRITLEKLNDALIKVMGWQGYHMSEFAVGDERFGQINRDFPENLKDWSRVRLDQVLNGKRNEMRFTYDFGDGWDHTISLEETLAFDKQQNLPVCIDGARACPPEDIGGFPGYEDFLQAIKDPKHSEYERYTDWLGGELFDPEEFKIPCLN